MLKKILLLLLLVTLIVLGVGSCIGEKAPLKVGMITQTGLIEDHSFNQRTWEGITRAGQKYGLDIRHYKPQAADPAAYMAGVKALYDGGFSLIVTTGAAFEDTLSEAQFLYPESRFIALDFAPETLSKNTVAIQFAEQEAAFLAGVATALQLKNGAVGGVFGEPYDPVKRFHAGFIEGIEYANNEFGTEITYSADHFVYANTFTDTDIAGRLASGLFDEGVDAVFAAAGGAGEGVISEAKKRREKGANVWVIGVDVDQYGLGIYDGTHSVILTSAVKKLDHAVYEVISLAWADRFPGGETLLFSAVNDGIGIPDDNPNLNDDVQKTISSLLKMIKDGNLAVSAQPPF